MTPDTAQVVLRRGNAISSDRGALGLSDLVISPTAISRQLRRIGLIVSGVTTSKSSISTASRSFQA